MKQGIFEIIENKPLRADVMRLRLRGDCSAIERAGQFVNIKIEGQFLRRPLSVCDVEGDVLTVCYQIMGQGTEKLAAMESGRLDQLLGRLDPQRSAELSRLLKDPEALRQTLSSPGVRAMLQAMLGGRRG